jgi:hypothetical protein
VRALLPAPSTGLRGLPEGQADQGPRDCDQPGPVRRLPVGHRRDLHPLRPLAEGWGARCGAQVCLACAARGEVTRSSPTRGQSPSRSPGCATRSSPPSSPVQCCSGPAAVPARRCCADSRPATCTDPRRARRAAAHPVDAAPARAARGHRRALRARPLPRQPRPRRRRLGRGHHRPRRRAAPLARRRPAPAPRRNDRRHACAGRHRPRPDHRSRPVLAFLHGRGRTLADCTQADADVWTAERLVERIRPFLTWAAARGHAPDLELPDRPRPRVTGPADHDARWTLARRLLHDDGIDPADRVAGALAVLYAQHLTSIAALRLDDLHDLDGQMHVSFGRDRVHMPGPLGQLLRELPWRRQIGRRARRPAPMRGCSLAATWPSPAPRTPLSAAPRPRHRSPRDCAASRYSSSAAPCRPPFSRSCSTCTRTPPPAGPKPPPATGPATQPTDSETTSSSAPDDPSESGATASASGRVALRR